MVARSSLFPDRLGDRCPHCGAPSHAELKGQPPSIPIGCWAHANRSEGTPVAYPEHMREQGTGVRGQGSVFRRFWDAIVEERAWRKAGGRSVRPDEVLDRESKCRVCPHRKGRRCGLCDCLIKAKARFATQSCPILQWLHVPEYKPPEGCGDCARSV